MQRINYKSILIVLLFHLETVLNQQVILKQSGKLQIQSNDYIQFRKKFINKFDSFFDSGRIIQYYNFKSYSNEFKVYKFGNSFIQYCYLKYYMQSQHLSEDCQKQLHQNMERGRNLTLSHNFSLFRNNFYDTPIFILDNQPELEFDVTDDIEVFFDSEIQIYENHKHFFYFVIYLILLAVTSFLFVCVFSILNQKLKITEYQLKEYQQLKIYRNIKSSSFYIENIPKRNFQSMIPQGSIQSLSELKIQAKKKQSLRY